MREARLYVMYTYGKHVCVLVVSCETTVQAVVTIASLILQLSSGPQTGQSPGLWAPHLCHPAFYYTLCECLQCPV